MTELQSDVEDESEEMVCDCCGAGTDEPVECQCGAVLCPDCCRDHDCSEGPD